MPAQQARPALQDLEGIRYRETPYEEKDVDYHVTQRAQKVTSSTAHT